MLEILPVTTLSFSSFEFTIVPPTSKMVGSCTCILLTTYLAFKQINQTFIITVKTMIKLMCVFCGKAGECISNFYVLTKLAPKTPTSSTTYTLSTGYNLDLTMQSFIFLALLHNAIGGGEKTFSTSFSL